MFGNFWLKDGYCLGYGGFGIGLVYYGNVVIVVRFGV